MNYTIKQLSDHTKSTGHYKVINHGEWSGLCYDCIINIIIDSNLKYEIQINSLIVLRDSFQSISDSLKVQIIHNIIMESFKSDTKNEFKYFERVVIEMSFLIINYRLLLSDESFISFIYESISLDISYHVITEVFVLKLILISTTLNVIIESINTSDFNFSVSAISKTSWILIFKLNSICYKYLLEYLLANKKNTSINVDWILSVIIKLQNSNATLLLNKIVNGHISFEDYELIANTCSKYITICLQESINSLENSLFKLSYAVLTLCNINLNNLDAINGFRNMIYKLCPVVVDYILSSLSINEIIEFITCNQVICNEFLKNNLIIQLCSKCDLNQNDYKHNSKDNIINIIYSIAIIYPNELFQVSIFTSYIYNFVMSSYINILNDKNFTKMVQFNNLSIILLHLCESARTYDQTIIFITLSYLSELNIKNVNFSIEYITLLNNKNILILNLLAYLLNHSKFNFEYPNIDIYKLISTSINNINALIQHLNNYEANLVSSYDIINLTASRFKLTKVYIYSLFSVTSSNHSKINSIYSSNQLIEILNNVIDKISEYEKLNQLISNINKNDLISIELLSKCQYNIIVNQINISTNTCRIIKHCFNNDTGYNHISLNCLLMKWLNWSMISLVICDKNDMSSLMLSMTALLSLFTCRILNTNNNLIESQYSKYITNFIEYFKTTYDKPEIATHGIDKSMDSMSCNLIRIFNDFIKTNSQQSKEVCFLNIIINYSFQRLGLTVFIISCHYNMEIIMSSLNYIIPIIIIDLNNILHTSNIDLLVNTFIKYINNNVYANYVDSYPNIIFFLILMCYVNSTTDVLVNTLVYQFQFINNNFIIKLNEIINILSYEIKYILSDSIIRLIYLISIKFIEFNNYNLYQIQMLIVLLDQSNGLLITTNSSSGLSNTCQILGNVLKYVLNLLNLNVIPNNDIKLIDTLWLIFKIYFYSIINTIDSCNLEIHSYLTTYYEILNKINELIRFDNIDISIQCYFIKVAIIILYDHSNTANLDGISNKLEDMALSNNDETLMNAAKVLRLILTLITTNTNFNKDELENVIITSELEQSVSVDLFTNDIPDIIINRLIGFIIANTLVFKHIKAFHLVETNDNQAINILFRGMILRSQEIFLTILHNTACKHIAVYITKSICEFVAYNLFTQCNDNNYEIYRNQPWTQFISVFNIKPISLKTFSEYGEIRSLNSSKYDMLMYVSLFFIHNLAIKIFK